MQENKFLRAKRVLVVRLDEVGDVVMTSPFLRELRRNMPRAKIALAVSPNTHNLVERCPYVDEVLVYRWQDAAPYPWKKKFDLAIIPRAGVDYYKASLLVLFGAAKVRIAYSERCDQFKSVLNKGYDRFFTHVLLDRSLKHEVERNMAMLCALGAHVESDALEVWTDSADEVFARTVMKRHAVGERDKLVCFGMGAAVAKKQWPVERYARVGAWLAKEHGMRILLLGNVSERALGEKYSAGASCVGLVNEIGRTTLRQAAALLKRCCLYVGNDSGLKHIAAAVKVPVVEISSWSRSGDPESQFGPHRFSPWGVRSLAVCPLQPRPPCTAECYARRAHCILQVTVKEVKHAVKEIMRRH